MRVPIRLRSCSSSFCSRDRVARAQSAAPVRTAPSTTAATPSTTAPRGEAVYASPGPYKVGYTTLRMIGSRRRRLVSRRPERG